MYKLIEVNNKKTIYSVLDTVTGKIHKFDRRRLIESSYEIKIQGVDNKYAQVKVQKPNDRLMSSWDYSRFLDDITVVCNGDFGKRPVNITITTLNEAEDLLVAKMLYMQGKCDSNIFFSWSGNELGIYTNYDRIVFIEAIQRWSLKKVDFPFQIGRVDNGGKIIDLKSKESIFNVCNEKSK